jgi:hypothetical protein
MALQEGRLTEADLGRIQRGLNPRSVMTGGTVFDQRYGAIHTLFLLMNILSPKQINWLIDRGWSRRLPFLGFSVNTFLMYTLTYRRGRVINKMEFNRTKKRYLRNILRIPATKAVEALSAARQRLFGRGGPAVIARACRGAPSLTAARRRDELPGRDPGAVGGEAVE